MGNVYLALWMSRCFCFAEAVFQDQLDSSATSLTVYPRWLKSSTREYLAQTILTIPCIETHCSGTWTLENYDYGKNARSCCWCVSSASALNRPCTFGPGGLDGAHLSQEVYCQLPLAIRATRADSGVTGASDTAFLTLRTAFT